MSRVSAVSILRLLAMGILALVSAFYILAQLYIAFKTLNYPYQLEWLEGGMMDAVQRVREGLPLYTAPTLEYPPYLYTPFYYYAAALFTYLLGINFVAGRIVSFYAVALIVATLYGWLRKEGASRLLAIAAGGLFCATYGISARWFYLARVDTLFVALTFAGLYLYACYDSTRTAIFSGILLALAFLTKQPALIIIGASLAGGFLGAPMRTLVVFAAFLAVTVVVCAIYHYISDGWFDIYVFITPFISHKNYRKWANFLRYDMWHNLSVAITLSACGIAWLLGKNWRRGLLYAGMIGGATLASMGARIHVGGYNNALMPGFVAVCLMAVLASHIISRERPWLQATVCLLLAAQMLLLFYDPRLPIPRRKNYEAGRELIDYIAGIQGEVLIPEMRFMQQETGKKSYSLEEITHYAEVAAKDKKDFETVHHELMEALREKKFAAIIVSRQWLLPEKDAYYRFKEKILDGRNNTYLMTGYTMKTPSLVYVPRDE